MRPADFCLIGRSHAVFPVTIPSFGKGLWASLTYRGATREAESGMSPGKGMDAGFLNAIIHLKSRLSFCFKQPWESRLNTWEQN